MRIALVLLTVTLWAQTPEQLRLSQQGKQLMGAGRFAEAVPVYQALTKQVPGNPGLQLNLGIALHMAGRDLEAVAVLEPVTKQLPQAFPAFILLGTSYMRLGQPSKAAGPLERAVQMAPQDVEARRILADALLASNRNLAAKPHLEALATQNRTRPSGSGSGVCMRAWREMPSSSCGGRRRNRRGWCICWPRRGRSRAERPRPKRSIAKRGRCRRSPRGARRRTARFGITTVRRGERLPSWRSWAIR
ncbi:MAG: hypothetical protein B7X34_05315 [Acidobacteriia bacterium 12-62-4]|nr:MAG: hypothetical protein B7X34_05315 [Acidobacteriia bacterium 12-62-4]